MAAYKTVELPSMLVSRYVKQALLLTFMLSVSLVVAAQSNIEKKQRIEILIESFSSEFSIPQVDVFTAKQLLTEKTAVFLDVRSAKEMQISMIPNAITKQQFEKNSELYKNSNIITYCTIGYRSSQYAEQWNKRGFHMSNLRGSLLLWTHAGGPLVGPDGKPTHRVHVYGKKWNLVPNNYQASY
jgi:rhodanese-related sulfurtransferase